MQVRKGDLLASRYLIAELIGQGAMGRVFKATDRETREDVAVKVIDAAPEDAQRFLRFEREVLTLKRLAHPHILRYLDHGREGEVYYLVTELVEGRTLDDAAAEFVGQAEKVFLLGMRLASAFAAAHRQGIVHRDIKPGNILLTATGEPRILDYGLARWEVAPGMDSVAFPTVEKLTHTNVLLGTIPYMSPEQIRAETADRRSDIFSLAVTLYELAGGRRPYEADSLRKLLEAMEAGRPPALHTLQADLLGTSGLALDMILRKALRPIPADRFPTMDELAEALEKGMDLYSSVPQDASLAILLPPVVSLGDAGQGNLFGRDAELGLLKSVLDRSRGGRGAAVAIEGPSGIGRSRLAAELTRIAHRQGFLCLPASVPEALAAGEHPARSWLARAGEVFPAESVVGRALDLSAAAPRSDQVQSVLSTLAQRMPLLLLLEDVHQAGSEVLDLLAKLVPFLQSRPIALVFTLRTDAPPLPASESALERLLALPSLERVDVGPLLSEDLRRMAAEIYPGLLLPEELLGDFEARSGGNPSYARGILKALVEAGALVRQGSDWILGEVESLPAPPGAQVVLEERTAGLGCEEKEILHAAAVLGASFEAARLAEILDWEPLQLDLRLRLLARRHRLLVAEDGAYRFDQPVTRDLLLHEIPRDERTALHLRAARTLRARVGASPDAGAASALAHHYLGADLPAEALPYALRAGLLLHGVGKPDEALGWLLRARSVIEQRIETVDGEEKEALRARLAEVELAIADCLDSTGRHSDALEAGEKARGLAASAGLGEVQVKSLIVMARAFFSRGDVLQAQRRAQDAQKLAKRHALDAERAVALSMEAHVLSRSGNLEEAEEKLIEAARSLDEHGRQSEAAEVYLALGNHYLRLDRYVQAESCYDQAASRVGRRGSPRLYARIQNTRGAVMLNRGSPAEGLLFFQEAATLRRSIGDRKGLAQSMHNIAYCHHEMGDLEEACRIYEQVLRLRAEIGETAERASSQRNYAWVLMDLGRLEQALAEANEAVTTKRQTEDMGYLPACLSLLGDIELELGRTERAREAYMEILRDFPDHRLEGFRSEVGLARIEWMAGRNEDAASRFERVLSLPESTAGSPDSLHARYQALVFFRAAGAGLDRLREIASPVHDLAPTGLLPEMSLMQALTLTTLAEAEGDASAVRALLKKALETSWKLGTVECTWRIHRDLARLEPEGSSARAAEIHAAREIVEGQAREFRQKELRTAYLMHRERAELLRLLSH